MPSRASSYDLILVGTGFASSFFLKEYLRHAPQARVLVLERGAMLSHAEHGSERARLMREAAASYRTNTPAKPWIFKLAFGGGSNCWVACTPRMTPEDFELQTRYGVGVDWPIGYDELEPYYCDVEDAMLVAGADGRGPWRRSRPFPQPPHEPSTVDLMLSAAAPQHWVPQPCARPTRPTPSGRRVCCATGVCTQCPVDAKFTILNELKWLYEGATIELLHGARATAIDHVNGIATGVRWRENDREASATAALVAIGANAIFNPHLLLCSGLDDNEVGRGLTEQSAVQVIVDLDGVEGFDGSTSVTAIGYPLHDGPHRATRAAALIESQNAPIRLRDLRGRWRERLGLKVIFEDFRQPMNRVTVAAGDPDFPMVTFKGPSDQTRNGLAAIESLLPGILRALPVERIGVGRPSDSEAHIVGTTPMGHDPLRSVVDADLRHHRVRNLLVLGSSVFPTCPPANPTLTLSALASRAAARLFA